MYFPSSLSFVEGSTGLFIATLGPVGYLPASGTCATAATLGLIYLVHLMHVSWFVYTGITAACALSAWWAIHAAQKYFATSDPREIVIDEVLGCLITFLWIPFTLRTALLGFILFRFFDITKIAGIRFLERSPGAWGIILDDVGAGIISNLFIHAASWFKILG